MNLRPDGPVASRLRLLDGPDDGLGRSVQVGPVHDLLGALGVDDHGHAAGVREAAAGRVHVLGTEELVDGAMARPEQHLRRPDALDGQAAVRLLRLPHRGVGLAAVTGTVGLGDQAEAGGGVAPEMLVGQEEQLDLFILPPRARASGERPFEDLRRVAARAARAAVAAHERLDRGGGVHVGDRDHPSPPLRRERVVDRLPRLHRVVDVGHVGHRAARGEIGQDHVDRVVGEQVRRLGHEVHAAEDDELRSPLDRFLRRHLAELQAVAAEVGVADDAVLLIVVREDEEVVPQPPPLPVDRAVDLVFAQVVVALGEGGLPKHR